MKFHIKQIILWFNNNSEPRSIDFLPNKVNVITGAKSTGKSSILSIIDYCFLSTESRIVEKVINENVHWYGMYFSINDKEYVIARKHPDKRSGSKEVYFSSVAEFPIRPYFNNDFIKLKSILEQEFSIDDQLIIPYGGKNLKAGSKISFRYFLLFNTLSEDTIADTNTFFDFGLYDREKYIEALDRIFLIAIGVDSVNNILVKEKIQELETELDKIEKKKKAVSKEERLFNEKILQLLIRAQEFDLIERKLFTHEEAYIRLQKLVTKYKSANYSNNLKQVDDLNKKKRIIWKKIRNLERFNSEYADYKKNLQVDYDSLRPIEYINANFNEIIHTVEVKTFLKTLEETLMKIRSEISNKKTITINVSDELSKLKSELAIIEKELSSLPTNTNIFIDEANKYVFIGELKSQLKFYEDKWDILDELPNIDDIYIQIEDLKASLKDSLNKKKIIIEFLESSIQKYYDLTNSMGVYKNYKVLFDESEKVLKLRKPDETSPSTIGSKSNFMFLHLSLFLGIHEHLIKQKQPYVPQFLILDQPSQPYLEKSGSNVKGIIESDDDRKTIKDAFKLLNTFITNIKTEYNNEFQIIMLEHAAKDYWEEPFLDNFHLVEEFRNGNALIPTRAIKEAN